MPSLRNQEIRGNAIALRDLDITPVERVTRISWRGGSYAWWRPIAVEVRRGADMRRIPIDNATRRAIARVVLSAALLGGLAWSAERIYRRGRAAR